MDKRYWRSLDHLEESDEHRRWVETEYPHPAMDEDGAAALSRRSFMGLMGASLALAGASGCIRRPDEHIMPYSKAPEEVLPGVPNYYATAYELGGIPIGVIARSNEGRPTKLEGNPDHPYSFGATDVYTQAALLSLYDPDRLTTYTVKGASADRSAFLKGIEDIAKQAKSSKGRGLYFLSERSSSPTLLALRRRMAASLPEARWHIHEPVGDSNAAEGIEAALGRMANPVYHFDKADIIVSLDSDFLGLEGAGVRHTRGWAKGRAIRASGKRINRLYVAEGVYSLTGGLADHRLKISSAEIGHVLRSVLAALGRDGAAAMEASFVSSLVPAKLSGEQKAWVAGVVADLARNRGRSLVVAGRRQPPHVHAMAHALNVALDNVGKTVDYYRPAEEEGGVTLATHDFSELLSAMKAKKVKTLVMLGTNPVYDSCADQAFGKLLEGVETRIRLGYYPDETTKACNWVAPQSHFLESWADVRAPEGTASIVQPLIQPLFDTISNIELVSYFADAPSHKGYDLVRAYWQERLEGVSFEKQWRRMVHDGFHRPADVSPLEEVEVDFAALSASLASEQKNVRGAPSEREMEIVFLQDAGVYDGRFANNGWLQELPDPVTKLTWDNAALMSEATARSKGVGNEDMVTLAYRGRSLSMPVWIVPGMADNVVALPLGYGRRAAGRVGNGCGFNTYLLRDSAAPDFDRGLTMEPNGGHYLLATTQEHGSMEDRPLVREADLEEYRAHPDFAKEMAEVPPLKSMYPDHEYVGQQWGLAIDLQVCTGCSTCVVACQAENNISVVGKKRVLRGREMHWMRVDRYFVGEREAPRAAFQPMPCQQCEGAPCEAVCPVAATSHSKKGGLNDMVYNRCIGTRYCSNNCPFKVRRFNFFNYHEDFTELEKMSQNPDVTVRMRGVMEKCTYCIQRINRGLRQAKLQGLDKAPDGSITPACAQACPAGAIVFGDIRDPESRVSKVKESERNYVLLEELNIRPRTSYLARVNNPGREHS